jgi:hypothetical protein
MNVKRPFRIIRVFDYPRWTKSTLPRIFGIVLYFVFILEPKFQVSNLTKSLDFIFVLIYLYLQIKFI